MVGTGASCCCSARARGPHLHDRFRQSSGPRVGRARTVRPLAHAVALALLYLFTSSCCAPALIVGLVPPFLFNPQRAGSLFEIDNDSLLHCRAVFDNPLTMRSIWTTMEVGLTTAVLASQRLRHAVHVHRPARPRDAPIYLISTLASGRSRRYWYRVAYLGWSWIGLAGRALRARSGFSRSAFVARFQSRYHEVAVTTLGSPISTNPRARGSGLGLRQGPHRPIRTIVLPLPDPATSPPSRCCFNPGAIRELCFLIFLYNPSDKKNMVRRCCGSITRGGQYGKNWPPSPGCRLRCSPVAEWLATGWPRQH